LPATANCVECSRRSSHRTRNVVDRDHLRSGSIRGRSLAGFGVPVAGSAR
jgi:hypothetical protein